MHETKFQLKFAKLDRVTYVTVCQADGISHYYQLDQFISALRLNCYFVFFIFIKKSNRTFCNQTVETLIRRRRTRRLIWVFTVCLCPTKSTLSLNGLSQYQDYLYAYVTETDMLGATFIMLHSGSVVECLTRDRRAAGSNLTGVTVLCPSARHVYHCLDLNTGRPVPI